MAQACRVRVPYKHRCVLVCKYPLHVRFRGTGTVSLALQGTRQPPGREANWAGFEI